MSEICFFLEEMENLSSFVANLGIEKATVRSDGHVVDVTCFCDQDPRRILQLLPVIRKKLAVVDTLVLDDFSGYVVRFDILASELPEKAPMIKDLLINLSQCNSNSYVSCIANLIIRLELTRKVLTHITCADDGKCEIAMECWSTLDPVASCSPIISMVDRMSVDSPYGGYIRNVKLVILLDKLSTDTSRIEKILLEARGLGLVVVKS